MLFYNERAYCGVGFSRTHLHTYHYAQELSWMRQAMATQSVLLKSQTVSTWFRFTTPTTARLGYSTRVTGRCQGFITTYLVGS